MKFILLVIVCLTFVGTKIDVQALVYGTTTCAAMDNGSEKQLNCFEGIKNRKEAELMVDICRLKLNTSSVEQRACYADVANGQMTFSDIKLKYDIKWWVRHKELVVILGCMSLWLLICLLIWRFKKF